jgi:hypothetical protein
MSAQYLKQAKASSFHTLPISQSPQANVSTVPLKQATSNFAIPPGKCQHSTSNRQKPVHSTPFQFRNPPRWISAQYPKQAKDSSFHIYPIPQFLQLNVTIVSQTHSNHSIIPSLEVVQFVTDRFVRVSTKNIHIVQATSATLFFHNKDEINHAEAPFPCQSHNLKHVVHHVGITETSLNSKVPRKVSWNSKSMPREQF